MTKAVTTMLVLDYNDVQVSVFNQSHIVETVFSDGAILIATPEDNDNYRATARRLGYGLNLWRMCYEHELCHSRMAIAAGQPWCWVLHGVATGDMTLTPHEIGVIEAAVLTNQRTMCS